MRDLSYGKGRTSPVKGAQIPKIDTIEAWDGKDGELPVEEEYDLSDVELDDLDKDELWLWKPELFKNSQQTHDWKFYKKKQLVFFFVWSVVYSSIQVCIVCCVTSHLFFLSETML